MSELGGTYDIEPDQVRITLQAVHTTAVDQLTAYTDLVTPLQLAGDGAGRLPVIVGALDEAVSWATDEGNALRADWDHGFTVTEEAVRIYELGDAAMAQDTVLDMQQNQPPVRIFDTTGPR